jgi:hypothetical protein
MGLATTSSFQPLPCQALSCHRGIEAAPINPSDIGPLFAPSHGGIGRFDGVLTSIDAAERPVTALPVPDRTFAKMKGVVGKGQRVGNEGAGRVVGAGKGARAQALKGKLVAAMGMGGSYAQHAVVRVAQCIEHLEGATAGAAAYNRVPPPRSAAAPRNSHAPQRRLQVGAAIPAALPAPPPRKHKIGRLSLLCWRSRQDAADCSVTGPSVLGQQQRPESFVWNEARRGVEPS